MKLYLKQYLFFLSRLFLVISWSASAIGLSKLRLFFLLLLFLYILFTDCFDGLAEHIPYTTPCVLWFYWYFSTIANWFDFSCDVYALSIIIAISGDNIINLKREKKNMLKRNRSMRVLWHTITLHLTKSHISLRLQLLISFCLQCMAIIEWW